MTTTLRCLASAIESSDEPAMGLLKRALLRDATDSAQFGTLTLSSAEEVAQLVALGALLACEENGKSELRGLKKDHSGEELTSRYEACSAANPFQSLKKAKSGEFVLDAKEKLPVFELDNAKIAPTLTSSMKAFRAAAALDLTELVNSTAFKEAFANQATHPTKLSAPAGKGGFRKVVPVPIPAAFPHVTEEDFATRETVTLAANASYQKMWSLLLPLFSYEGQVYRLSSFFSQRPDVAAAVSQVLTENGVTQGAAAIQALAALPAPGRTFSGEPQVFCGNLPQTERVSVMAPFGLFKEIGRAKRALKDEYQQDALALADTLQAEIDGLGARIEKLSVTGNAGTDKKKLQREKALLADQVRKCKDEQKRLQSTWLKIPSFTLMFGGAIPRNVALDLDTTLHSANVQVYIPSPRTVVKRISNRAFRLSSLVSRPRLSGSGDLPRFLEANALGAKLKRARQDFFAGLICEAMAPLKDMQLEWQTRSKQFAGDVALSNSAQRSLAEASGPFALFIKGDQTLNNKEAMGQLLVVVEAICKTVLEALWDKYSTKMHSTFDRELFDLATNAVALEKA